MKVRWIEVALIVITGAFSGGCGTREEARPEAQASSPAVPPAAAEAPSPATSPEVAPGGEAAPAAAAATAEPAPAPPPPASTKRPSAARPESATGATAPTVAPPTVAPPTAAPAPPPPPTPAPTALPAPARPATAGVVDPGGDVAVSPGKAGLTRIGAGKCKMCHKVQHASWAGSAHARRTPPLDCEACHGPGSEYKVLAVMKDPAKARAAGLVQPDLAFCGRCHEGKPAPGFLGKAHEHRTAS